jgi:hypothetical protein
LEKCRGESETAVLIHCQTDIVNYEIEQWLPAENLGEREINPVIENKDEGKCAVFFSYIVVIPIRYIQQFTGPVF